MSQNHLKFYFSFSLYSFLSVQFSSVAQSCPTFCDPMNGSTPDLPVHHHLPEFTQTHFHRVSDAIQLSHPLSSPFPPAPNPSQLQSFLWGNSGNSIRLYFGGLQNHSDGDCSHETKRHLLLGRKVMSSLE